MKHRRKIFIGLMTTMLLAVTLVTSTFAWISQTTTGIVSGFEFSVNGGQGFLVSLDDVNYSNDITSAMMKRAIVRGYNPVLYVIEDGELYLKVGDDNTGYKYYLQDDTMVQSALSNIELLPLTSNDGINLSDLFGTPTASTSGKYVEFTIYVKAASPNVDDNMTYGIYLAGEDITLANTSTVIPKCSFVSEVTKVDLKNKMTIYTGDVLGPDEENKSIDVYTSNCLRMSVEDVTKNNFIESSNEEILKNDPLATTTPLEPAKIFELNDTINGPYRILPPDLLALLKSSRMIRNRQFIDLATFLRNLCCYFRFKAKAIFTQSY